jgi:phenylacetate-CoA ligase
MSAAGRSAIALDHRLREAVYFGFHRLSGGSLGRDFRQMRAEDDSRTAHLAVPERVRALLRHAVTQVPFYGEQLAGREAEIERDPLAVLRSLPILTKEDIRSNFTALSSRDLADRATFEQTSGGSTGEPLRLVQDAHFRAQDQAVQLLLTSWAGLQLGEPEVMLLGSERDILEHTTGMRARVANGLLRRDHVNAFRMSRESMTECLRKLDREPPALIFTYAQSIYDLAVFAEEEGIRIAPQRSVLSTAGTLHPFMRERIEQTFRCRVYNQYGSREVSAIAGQCGSEPSLHVLPWMNYVEVVGEDGESAPAGTDGRVLVTSLCNFAMPLIRYEVGDRAALLPDEAPPCPCGRGGQRLSHVAGRVIDTFKALDGTLVNGEFFTHLLYFRPGIVKFQIVQTDPARVVYRLVGDRPLGPEEEAEVAEGTRKAMGEACQVDFERLEEIPTSPSGKFRYTICEC